MAASITAWGGRAACALAVCLAIPSVVSAQDVGAPGASSDEETTVVEETTVTETTIVEETVVDEPVEEAAPHTTRTVTRRTTPESPQAYDTELPPLTLAPPPEAGFEIAIAMNPSLLLVGFGGVTPTIVTSTDLMVALDPRAWIGLGLSVSYVEQRTMAFPGVPEMRFVTTTIGVPLLFQYYFAHPELGAAVPTLRVRLAGTWSETPNTPSPSTQTGGADLALYGGVTWMGASWLALRILGGLNAGFRATVVGPVVINATVGIEAQIAAVVRL